MTAPGLDGAVAVVTGGASGIGEAIARGLAAAGAHVAIADLNAEAAGRVAGELDGFALPVDIADEEAVEAAAVEVAAQLGAPRVLVNCAGVVGGGGPLLELPVALLDLVLRVNIRGTFLATKAFGRRMAAAGAGGAIVNISSIGGSQPTVGLGHYEATKAAVDALTRSSALELAPHGIRVNAIAPGPVLTPMTSPAMGDPGARAMWEERIPLGRIASVDDLAPLAVFLASDASGHVTGAVVPVDGGQLLR